MTRVFRWLVVLRIPLLVLVLLSLVPAGRVLPRLSTNNSIDTFLAADDPGLAFYRETTDIFGSDHLVYVAVGFTGGVFSAAALRRLDRLTERLGDLPGVEEVTSVTSTDAVSGRDGAVVVGPVFSRPPGSAAEVRPIKRKVLTSDLLRRFVSKDNLTTLLVVEMERRLHHDPQGQNAVVKAVRRQMEREVQRGRIRFGLAGNSVITEAISEAIAYNERVFSSLMLLLVVVASALLLRRFLLAMLPLIVVMVTAAWAMALFVATGHQTNWVTSIITPILFIVGVADVIHLVARYQDLLPGASSPREAVVAAVKEIFLPCLLTTLTTAAGFASLMVNKVMPVKVFGIFAAIGVMLALLAAVVIVPSLLALRGSGPAKPKSPGGPGAGAPAAGADKPSLLLGLLAGVNRLGRQRPTRILVVSIVLVGLAGAGLSQIRVETNLLKYFKQEAPVVQDARFIEGVFTGTTPLDIVIDTGRSGGAQEPEILRKVELLQRWLDRQPKVVKGVSLTDLIKELYMVTVGDRAHFVVPETRRAVSQLLLLTTPKVLEPMVDPGRRRLRISTRFAGARMGLGQSRALLDKITARADQIFLKTGAKVRLTGSSLLFINMDRYLVSGQIQSFGVALAVLLLVMMILFRSPRIGLLAMVPNVLPIAVMLGLMGWLGIPIDPYTVMIASIAIGIGVDDTIHYLYHLRRELAGGAELEPAMAATMIAVGRPLLFTSIMLALGFWVFCFSDFIGARNFGLLTGVTVLVALAADLLLLPALLRLIGIPHGWGKRARGEPQRRHEGATSDESLRAS